MSLEYLPEFRYLEPAFQSLVSLGSLSTIPSSSQRLKVQWHSVK